MRYVPFRTLIFSGLMVLGFFSCKPSGGDSQPSVDSEVLSAESTDGASFALQDTPPCPKPAQDEIY